MNMNFLPLMGKMAQRVKKTCQNSDSQSIVGVKNNASH